MSTHRTALLPGPLSTLSARSALGALLLAPLCVLPAGCSGGGDQPAAAEVTVEDLLARERAAAHFNAPESRLGRAREALAPLVARPDALLDDLVHAAAIEVGSGDYDAAEAFLARAAKLSADDPRIAYMRGRMANNTGRTEEALAEFEKALAVVPDDLPSRLCLAQALLDLERGEEAEKALLGIIEVGLDAGGSWYFTAVYRLMRYYLEEDRLEESRTYQELWTQLTQQGFQSVGEKQLDEGDLGGVQPPEPDGPRLAKAPAMPAFEAAATILPELVGASGFALHDLSGDRLVDVLAWGPKGVRVAVQGYDEWRVYTVRERAATGAVAFDLGNDDDLDVLVFDASGVELYESIGEPEDEEWSSRTGVLPEVPGTIAQVVALDADHEGDLDLLLVGDFGARLWRNDGAREEEGRFSDASEPASLPKGVALEWIVTEDYDSDQDVDVLLGGPGGVFLMTNERGGHFVDVAAQAFGGGPRPSSRPLVCDLDADSRPDLLFPTAGGRGATLLVRLAQGGYEARTTNWMLPEGARAHECDLDLDGAVDVLWVGADGGLAGVLAAASEAETPIALEGHTFATPLSIADLDRDADHDLVHLGDGGLVVHATKTDGRRAIGLEWIGVKDNRRAIGAICETRVGGTYRRIYWRGDAELAGVGESDLLDVVRVTWPNGVVQTELDIEPGYLPIDPDGKGPFEQSEGLIGSCPFLYTWNGTEYEFISDVLGITPLGLPMAPGMLVPPDHDEFVLVRGEQLQPKDGVLKMQFTEELREVTYLDRIRLDVVDHPVGTEIFPDERFCFPPFPAGHTHVIEDPLPPARATGSDGGDWAPALAAIDDTHAIPFEPLHGQFLGLATPHWIELEFDPARIASATKLRLVLTGWFYWTDASVNMASARHPGIDFVPPLLQVPDGQGGWRETGPPIGFPAGKTKSMVVDVSQWLGPGNNKLRLFSTLRLYWDRIVLATDGDDAELRVTEIEPSLARLWPRGFSAAVETERDDLPERFDFERLADVPRWNQHPGLYTRFGNCLSLVTEIDDRLVIMGSGDALEVHFPADALPPLAPGMRRDYLVFLDGWAKDRDPNTIDALTVEPLPFHGMSAYPYGEDEHAPDTELHRKWRAEWNTRPAHEAVVPLSPRARREWLLGPSRP